MVSWEDVAPHGGGAAEMAVESGELVAPADLAVLAGSAGRVVLAFPKLPFQASSCRVSMPAG